MPELHPEDVPLRTTTRTASADTSIRPFTYHASDEALADLRRRIDATKWPSQELVPDAIARCAARDDARARALLADGLRLAQVRSEAERVAAIRDEHRRGGHPFHPRPFEASECVADDRHARVARLDHRADEDHRSADQPDGARRERVGRIRRRDSVTAGPRVFGEADRSRLGSHSHRTRLDRADEAPRLHALCRARRRLGQCRHRADGPADASGTGRHPHQHACHGPRRHRQGAARPAGRRHPASQPTRSTRTISSTSSTSTAWPTPRR